MKKIFTLAVVVMFFTILTSSGIVQGDNHTDSVAEQGAEEVVEEMQAGSDQGSAKGSEIGLPKGSPMQEGSPKGSPKELPAAATAGGEGVEALIAGTAEDSKIMGVVGFIEEEGQVKVVAMITGVEQSGNHGIHIHQNGSCEDGGKAAGGHYNPHGVDHGNFDKSGIEGAHAGDLGNIAIDASGNGAFDKFLPGITLKEIAGRAVILHELEDDFGQPTGNAGGRIGCGVISDLEL